MMQKKKIMVLGGSPFQIPLIKKAKAMGLHVITCDYLPTNPGHALADEYHNASTTDKQAALQVAQQCGIDAIATFCSDPAVPTVAYVATELGLPGPSLAAVEKLTEKDKFRQLMREAGLNVPQSFTLYSADISDDMDVHQRYIVKPVDSSGSKGITRSAGTRESLANATKYALSFSRAGRCIVETYIDGPQLHGDAFVHAGKVIYHYLGDHYFFTKTNSFIPISTRWPASAPQSTIESIIEQVERITQAAGYTDGPINIEARVDSKGTAYIIEVGPRNGGNFVPIIQQNLSGFDFTQAVVDMALGNPVKLHEVTNYQPGAHYILHSDREGTLVGVNPPEELERYIFYKHVFKQPGATVRPYTGSNETIGVFLFEFPSVAVRDRVMGNTDLFSNTLSVETRITNNE